MSGSFTEDDVLRYAQFVTGHPDAEVDARHLAAVRAVLGGLDQDGRLRQPDAPTITVIDVAAEARAMWGENADAIVGRALPEHEHRFELHYPNGARATMFFGATASDVVAEIEHRAGSRVAVPLKDEDRAAAPQAEVRNMIRSEIRDSATHEREYWETRRLARRTGAEAQEGGDHA